MGDATLSDADARYVERRREQALWYAWGAMSAGLSLSDDEAWRFSHFAADEARAYRTDQVSCLHSVPDQLQRFMAAEQTTTSD